VPLTISHPAYRARNGTRTRALACLSDLFPTIAESLGLSVPGNVHGRSLLPVLSGERDSARDAVFSELHVRGGAYYGARDADWKLAIYGDQRQLFDLQTDPGERRNLAHDAPEQAARLERVLEGEAARQ
jgi:arylsulfatase A-like enzyme